MEDQIAYRKLIGQRSNNEEFDIEIRIGKPFQESEHEWKCPVRIDGLHGKTMFVEDIDSFAVLNQAIGLALFYLENHEENGGKLFWAFNREIVSTKDEIF